MLDKEEKVIFFGAHFCVIMKVRSIGVPRQYYFFLPMIIYLRNPDCLSAGGAKLSVNLLGQ